MIEGQEDVRWADWCALAAACEAHGVETLFRSDHYIAFATEGGTAHDAWTTLAALAARTSTLRLGTLVSPATFRAPALLANAAATVDHVSGGRIEVGLGAGWLEREHRAYGFPFPDAGTRMELLAEQLEIVHRLWRRSGWTSVAATTRLSARRVSRAPCSGPVRRSSWGAAARPAPWGRPCASRTSTTRRSSRPRRPRRSGSGRGRCVSPSCSAA